MLGGCCDLVDDLVEVFVVLNVYVVYGVCFFD